MASGGATKAGTIRSVVALLINPNVRFVSGLAALTAIAAAIERDRR